MKREKDIVCYLADAWSLLFVIGLIIFIIVSIVLKTFNSIVFWLYGLNLIFILFLYAIGHLRERVASLEYQLIKKKVLKEEDLPQNEIIEEEYKMGNKERSQSILLCPHCGFQVFPEDKECSYCHKKLKDEKLMK